MLLTGLEPATHGLKGHYSTIELQKHGAHRKIRTPAPVVSRPHSFQNCSLKPLEYVGIYGTPNENRTRISALKGRRPIPLVDESMVEQEGLEPPTPEAPDLQSGTLPITLYCSKF